MAETLRRLWAKCTDDGAVWDRSPDQLGGEIFITGPDPMECFATPRINEAIAERRLVEVPSPHEAPKPAGKA